MKDSLAVVVQGNSKQLDQVFPEKRSSEKVQKKLGSQKGEAL